MKFNTKYKRIDKITPTNAGDGFLNVYQEEIKKDGTKGLICIGKTNIEAKIQEDAEMCDIHNIIKAVAMGDLSILRNQEPTYIDSTTFPKTLMEAQNIMVKAKSEFENLPREVKELFNNSPEVYVSEIGTTDYLEKMAPYNEKIKAVKEAGSLKEYNKKVADQAKFERDLAAAKEVKSES